MTSTRTTVLATGTALLLALVIAAGAFRSRSGTIAPPAEEPFHASDVALIGHTGSPQLVEFYHPA